MDYLPFAAMVIAVAAGLAGLAARLALPARLRDAGMVTAMLAAAVLAFVADLPGPLHARLFGPAADGEAARGGLLADLLDGYSEGFSRGFSDSLARQRTAEIKAEMRAQNYEWMFDGEADLDRFAQQVVAEGAGGPDRLAQAFKRLLAERVRRRMGLLHQARLAEVTDIVAGAVETLGYFIDHAQFGNCRTFLLGGYDFPDTDPQLMIGLAGRLGAAVRSGQRGEKDWVELSAADTKTYTASAVTHLLEQGYTKQQLGAAARLDTTDPDEMESNCRIARDMFAHLAREYPPEVAASIYISQL